MIVAIGEVLVDLVVGAGGAVEWALGGAPFTTARACARLGADAAFVGAISDDRFGELLIDQLAGDEVVVAQVTRVPLPTTLAVAELDGAGTARYRFYVDGTSAPALTVAPRLDGATAVFTGGLGLTLEPMADTVERAIAGIGEGTTVIVDINCRPAAIRDRDGYLGRVRRVLTRADLVKASVEDLEYFDPGADPIGAAEGIVVAGARAVVVTAGAGAVTIVTASGPTVVPVEPVAVVDTIGAGDTFSGALLAWLGRHRIERDRLGDPAVLEPAVRAATVAAGVACGRRGADPPHLDDLPEDWSA